MQHREKKKFYVCIIYNAYIHTCCLRDMEHRLRGSNIYLIEAPKKKRIEGIREGTFKGVMLGISQN